MPPPIIDNDASDASDGMEDVVPAKKSTAPKAKAKPATSKKPAAPRRQSARSALPEPDPEPEEEEEEEEDQQEEELAPEVNDVQDDNDDEEDDDDEDDDEETFIVESILRHHFEKDGTLKYEIKWLGYEAKADRTFEPESNIVPGAADILEAYHKKVGGKPQKPATPAAKARGRGKRKSTAPEETPDVESSTRGKRRKLNGAQKPEEPSFPTGSWEDDVEIVSTIEEKLVTFKGKDEPQLRIFVTWNNGRNTEHAASLIREKCPQKLLDYLFSKLVFKGHDDADIKEDAAETGAATLEDEVDEEAVDEEALEEAIMADVGVDPEED